MKHTQGPASVRSVRVRGYGPVCASHTLTVLSWLPEARHWPSAENATLVTPPVCPQAARGGETVRSQW